MLRAMPHYDRDLLRAFNYWDRGGCDIKLLGWKSDFFIRGPGGAGGDMIGILYASW